MGGGKGGSQTVGYRYLLGMHMILGHGPFDKITQFSMDNRLAWEGMSTGGQIQVDAPDLFGGDGREGGVSGTIDVEMGADDQIRNDYLQSQLRQDIPAYLGLVGLVFRQFYFGNNPYIKRPKIRASRIHTRSNGVTQWYDEKAEVNGDMNPAHIIRECLTDKLWGMGYNDADMDDAAFQAVADTLHTEGLGISLLWDRQIEIQEFISRILEHIDAALYMDRRTGKFTLQLVRDDYDPDTLLELDESNVKKVSNFRRGLVAELTNSVTVKYWDKETGRDGSITVQDTALAAQQQATVGTTRQYPGITNGTNASKLASRDLRALSTPLAEADIYATREAASLNVGDVFKFSWDAYGVVQLIMRVAQIELGGLGSGVVKLKCIEDVFATAVATYAAPPASKWVNPVNPPAACPYHVAIESPYWMVLQALGETEAEAQDPAAGYTLFSGVAPSPDATGGEIHSKAYGDYEKRGRTDFTPTGTLASAAVQEVTSTWTLENTVSIDQVEVGDLALLESELLEVTAIAGTDVTFKRGLLDTVPVEHAAGARVFFLDGFYGSDEFEYADGETAYLKLLPRTGQGLLPIGDAPQQAVTMASRLSRPYRPAYLRVNGLLWPAPTDYPAYPVDITWRERNRLTETTGTFNAWNSGSTTPEAGTSYDIKLEAVDTNGNVTGTIKTDSVTATSYQVTEADLGATYAGSPFIRVTVTAVRDGLTSWQAPAVDFRGPFAAPENLQASYLSAKAPASVVAAEI